MKKGLSILFLFSLFSFSYGTFAPFSLTNSEINAMISPSEDKNGTITAKEMLKDRFSKEEEFEDIKEDFQDEIERLEKERALLLTKEKIGEREEKQLENDEGKGEKEEEKREEDLILLRNLADNRVKEAETRRKILLSFEEEKSWDMLKTKPGEAVRVKLPEESELNVIGRKFIKMGYSGKNLLNTSEKKTSSSQINIDQELEVKIKGIVKKKVSVDVDYSDKSQDILPPRKTFLITYTGEKKETIQEAVFGDVSLEIPQSRFTGYKKSAFGISTKAQMLNNKLNLAAIASREKGESKSKLFKGTTTEKVSDIQDSSFIRRRFYQILAYVDMGQDSEYGGRVEWLKKMGYLPIRPGSFYVYIDDKNPNNNTNAIPLTGWTYNGSISYTGLFDLKYPGDDYAFDYNTGILSFKNQLSENDVVFISFINGLGSLTTNLILKNEKEEEIKNPELYELFELKGYYTIPRKLNINLPDFSFQIVDSAGKYWYDLNNNGLFDSDELTYVRIFGLDREERYDLQGNERPGYNKVDKEFLDLDLGYLTFPDRLPFEFQTSTSKGGNRFYYEDKWFRENIIPLFKQATLTEISNPNCYKEYPQAKYTIKISYPGEETYGFSLDELNIVPESEAIYINGNRLSKSEYAIDYETGWITIYRKVQPTDNIKVDYEYAPFLGVYQKSLFGTRFDYRPNKHFLFGGTYIGESGKGLRGVPSVTHPSTSISVFDIDSSLSLTDFLKEKMNYQGPLSLNLKGEIAHCIQNPNTYGYGMIDAMDSTEDSVEGGISEDNWQTSSLKGVSSQIPRGKIFYFDEEENKMYPYEERCGPYLSDGGHRSDEKQEKQRMLNFNLFLGTDSSESFVGLVTSLSREGIDLSGYSFIEILSNIPSSNTIKCYLDLGIVSEDADGDLRLDTEDINNDGYLNPGEDIGFPFSNQTRVGCKNQKLDSEDLDQNGRLDVKEAVFSYFINDERYIKDIANTVSGWKLYRIPLYSFERKDPEADMRIIKHLRLRFENASTSTCLSTLFSIDKIAIGGSNWERPVIDVGTGSIFLLGKHSKEDPDYIPLLNDPIYKKLHENEDIKGEGALAISYDFATYSSAYIRKTLGRIQNYNPYKSLGFWVYGLSGTQSLSLRFGHDASNYFEYNIGTISKGWSLIKIDLFVFRELIAKGGTQSGSFLISNAPGLARIKEIRFIIRACGKGEIWLNELHVSDVVKREGNAYFALVSGGLNRWFNFNFDTTDQGGDFRTIGPQASSNEINNTHFDLNITRFSFLPLLSVNYNKSKNALSYENVDEITGRERFGKEEKRDKVYRCVFDYNKKKNKGFPILSVFLKENEFLSNYSDYNKEGENREIGGSITHTYNIQKATSSISTSYGFTKLNGNLNDYLNKTNSNEKDEISHSAKAILSFAPKAFLTGSNISFEKQIQLGDIKYKERQGTGTIEKSDKNIDIASCLLKFNPKRAISKAILPKSSFSSEYSITNTKEDIKTSYEGIPESKVITKTEKDRINETIGINIFPYKTQNFENNYHITQTREKQSSNIPSHRYETMGRNQSCYILQRDQNGLLTIGSNKVSFIQNEAKTKDDKALLLTNREIKYDLDKMEIKRLSFIPFISSTRIDKKFYFLENYDITTDRRVYKKRASTSSYLGINHTLSQIEWKDYKISLSTSFTLDCGANYDNLSKDEETLKTLLAVYNDFHKGLLFKRRGVNGDLYSKAKRKTAYSTRSFTINGTWNLYPHLTTNSQTGLTWKEEENGVLWTDAISHEINNTLDLLKAKPSLSNRLTSSSLKANYKIAYSHQYTNTSKRLTGITHNPYIEWNAKWKNNLQTTAIIKTILEDTKNALDVITKNIEVYPSFSFSYDYTKPGFLKIPGINKAISLERKLTLSGAFNTSFKRKRIASRKDIDEDSYNFDLSGTYRIQENTSGTLGLNLSYLKDRVRLGRDCIGYGSYVSLEFRF